ncbi:hypothetical protein [Parasphingorhabdus pacifica]
MNRATPDPETPIFRELNNELGDLPEIDVHDFDAHAFGLLTENPENSDGSDSSESGNADGDDSETSETAAQDSASQPTRISAGGRRRKES